MLTDLRAEVRRHGIETCPFDTQGLPAPIVTLDIEASQPARGSSWIRSRGCGTEWTSDWVVVLLGSVAGDYAARMPRVVLLGPGMTTKRRTETSATAGLLRSRAMMGPSR